MLFLEHGVLFLEHVVLSLEHNVIFLHPGCEASGCHGLLGDHLGVHPLLEEGVLLHRSDVLPGDAIPVHLLPVRDGVRVRGMLSRSP